MISDADDRFNTRVHKIVRDFTEAFFFFFFYRDFWRIMARETAKKENKKGYTLYNATAK